MESVRGKFTIVPIMVGSLSPSLEAKYGKILAKYLEVSQFSVLLDLRNKLEIWRRSGTGSRVKIRVSDPYKLIRIRIQRFRMNTDPDPGVL